MIVDIFIVILLISASVLCIYLVITLKKLTESIKVMQSDIDRLVTKTLPVLENLNEVSEKALKITNDIESAYSSIQDKISGFRENFENVITLKKVKDSFSLTEFITNLRAITKGIIVFIKELRK